MLLENIFIFFKREGEVCVWNVSDFRNVNEMLRIVEIGDEKIFFYLKYFLLKGSLIKLFFKWFLDIFFKVL